ncbi:unnamed protein product [Gadus morhua 'NCC']
MDERVLYCVMSDGIVFRDSAQVNKSSLGKHKQVKPVTTVTSARASHYGNQNAAEEFRLRLNELSPSLPVRPGVTRGRIAMVPMITDRMTRFQLALCSGLVHSSPL